MIVSYGSAAPLPLPTYSDKLTLQFDTSISLDVGIPLVITGPTEIDWGDGSIETANASGWYEHSFAGEAIQTVTCDGPITKIFNNADHAGRYDALVAILSWGDSPLEHISFNGAANLVEVPPYLPETVTSLDETFKLCEKFNHPNIIAWNMGNVQIFRETWKDAKEFDQPIGYNDTSSATNWERTFGGARDFNRHLLGWDPTLVTDASDMMRDMDNFNSDLWQKPMASLTAALNMFLNNKKFNKSLEFVTIDQVANLANFLSGCLELDNDSIELLNPANCTSAVSFMLGCAKAKTMPKNWPKLVQGFRLCQGCVALDPDLTGVQFPELVTGDSMFSGNSKLGETNADFSAIIFPKLESAKSMFAFCVAANISLAACVAKFKHVNLMFRGNVSQTISLANLDFSELLEGPSFIRQCANYNAPVPLNMPLVTNLSDYANGALIFAQDMSGACVPLIPAEPSGFATNTQMQPADKPVWGTCP